MQSKSKRLLAFCFCFLLGVFIASLIDIRISWYWGIGAVLLWASAPMVADQKKRWILYLLAFLCLGIFRYAIAWPELKKVDTQAKTRTELSGYIDEEPDKRIDKVNYVVNTTEFGRVYVSTLPHPEYEYGDQVNVSCNLQLPEAMDGFAYDKYLARYHVFYLCVQPSVKKVGEGKGNIFFQKMYGIKARLAQHISLLWHEPEASFVAGLLYGYRGGLGALNDLFAKTGVTHIVAISGYNISIIAVLLSGIFLRLGIPRKKAFYVIVISIVLFVVFTGMSASAVRAGVMGGLLLLGKQFGRLSRILNVMILCGTIMVAINPFILIADAGFQLSFLSTLGLVYLSPILKEKCSWIPEKFGLQETVLATMAATLFTLPLILFQFGRLSLVSLPVNVLILWIIPWIMLATFIALCMSFISLSLAQVLSVIGLVGLKYIIGTVIWFAHLSFSAVSIQIPWWGMVILYGILIKIILQHNKKIPP